MLPPSHRRILEYLSVEEQFSEPWAWKDVYRIAFCIVCAAGSGEPVRVEEIFTAFAKTRYAAKIGRARTDRRAFLQPFIRDGQELSDAELALDTRHLLATRNAGEIVFYPDRKQPVSDRGDRYRVRAGAVSG